MTIQRILLFGALAIASVQVGQAQDQTVAHQWNEQLLEAIRNDFARPTVHARNLYLSLIHI